MKRHIIVLTAFAVVFVALTASSYTQKSATWDEPQHLTTGYLMWKNADYRTDPEHPPFLRMWAALPLVFTSGIQLNTGAIDHIPSNDWIAYRQFEFCHWFLYEQNDADRLLYRGRFMIVLLGVLLGALVFAWTNELWGFWPACVALALYTLEPNILAHSSLVTTDFGVTAFFFGTVYFLWRWLRQPKLANAAGFVAFFVLSAVSKFTAVLLLPVCLILVLRRAQPVRHVAMLFATALIVAWIAVWAMYGFRYLPSRSPDWKFRVQESPQYGPQAPKLTAAVLAWVDDHRLVPNAYAQGFLLGQSKAQRRSAYLAGQISSQGWWYFFPVAYLIKTPLAFLAMLACGVYVAGRWWRELLAGRLFLLVPVIVVVGMAMAAKLNIGVRHILPVVPFAAVLAAGAVPWFVGLPGKAARMLPAAAVALAVVECAWIWPDYLAFFNGLVGGPRSGSRYLVDSNLDWGQDLKPLKRWMDKNRVEFINLSYFGTADAGYYKINCQHLPGAPFFNTPQVGPPRLPGLIAVSATNLRGVYFDDATREFFRPMAEAEPVAVVGHSIFIYQADAPGGR